MASWGVAVVSPDNFVRVLCDPRVPAFLGGTSYSNNTAELTEALRWANFFIPRRARFRILFDPKHGARVTLGVAHAQISYFCPSCFSHAGNAGNECADGTENEQLFFAQRGF